MRIAIFTEYYFPFVSGVVTHIQTLSEGLVKRGHEVMIVTLDPNVNCHYLKENGSLSILYCPAIPMKKFYGYGIANPLNSQRMKIISDFAPDILHVHTEFTMGIFANVMAYKLHVPIVYTLHTMYDDYLFYLVPFKWGQQMVKPAAHGYLRSIASRATEIIGPSLKVKEYLRRCGVEKEINIVPNTVDVSAFLPENVDPNRVNEVRQILGIQKGDIALCFVGRLGAEKSIDVLINFFAEGFKTDARYKLFIIGDGPEKDNLKEQIHSLALERQVRLVGRIEHEDLPPYYHACDLFAMASLSEMNSISALEAMASGLYVIQRLDVYNKDQISSGENGETFETSAEFTALVKAEGDLTDDEREARRKRVTSFSRRYGENEFMERILSVYNKALSEYRAKKSKPQKA